MNQLALIDLARAAKILGARWENDPLRLWQPSPKQQQFLSCDKSEVALLGANRSGKSDPLAVTAASIARFGNPNPTPAYSSGGRLALLDRATSVWVIGLTERLTKEGIQPKIVTTAYTQAETHPAFIPPCEIDSWNINDQTWRLKNGSILTFKSADAGRDVFQSAARDAVLFDEICEWEVYKEATFRVPGANRRLLIRLAATLLPPLGMAGGVSWFYPKKIKPWWAAGNKENRDQNPDAYLNIYTMSIRENPHISRDEIARLEQMFPPGSVEARIRLYGELVASLGGSMAYPAYNSQIHFDQTLLPTGLDRRHPLCLCVDFNVEPCIWEIGQYIDDTWFFFDEIRLDCCNVPDMTDLFRQRYPTHSAPLYIYGDQTGMNRSVQTAQSHYYLMQEGLRSYPAPVELKLPERNPYVVDRLNAMNRKLSGADGKVGFYHGPLCVELQKDLEEVERDPRGGIKKTNHKDSPYYERTHASDAVGYGVAYTDPVPEFIAVDRSRLRSIPTPGYLGRGGRACYGMQRYPSSYDADRRIRRGPSGGILPPQKP